MKTPFIFGKIAYGEDFTDRKQETLDICNNFRSMTNTIIVAPRRWGKSSLVEKAAEKAKLEEKDLKVCFVNLFNVRNEADFYVKYANGIIKGTTSKAEEAVKVLASSFKRLIPKVTITGDNTNDFSFSFDWEDAKSNPDEILDLAEHIATKKKIRIIVCLDEFQNIAEFDDALYFQRTLRAHWQEHKNVAYCLYGSKLHMMKDIFTNYSMPFYKFGDLRFLSKISTAELTSFIMKRFDETGKSIGKDAARLIVTLADNHPYYVQQLAQMSWLRTETYMNADDGAESKECDELIVSTAHAALVGQLSMLFLNSMDEMTSQQINYLHALIDGEKAITTTNSLKKYGITSATSANRSKNTLIQKDILDNTTGTIALQDPIFSWWLKNVYFK